MDLTKIPSGHSIGEFREMEQLVEYLEGYDTDSANRYFESYTRSRRNGMRTRADIEAETAEDDGTELRTRAKRLAADIKDKLMDSRRERHVGSNGSSSFKGQVGMLRQYVDEGWYEIEEWSKQDMPSSELERVMASYQNVNSEKYSQTINNLRGFRDYLMRVK
tara:strand:+ start:8374 stop:8862 length:489 start_codon:yes stop_codon:yes gene_type:complete